MKPCQLDWRKLVLWEKSILLQRKLVLDWISKQNEKPTCHKYLVLHCCFSYHSLLELHYTDKWNKLAAAKKWAQAEGISEWEVEQCLDMDLFLDKYPRWKADGLQCPVILQGMFSHAEMAGQKEYEWAICCDHKQSYLGLDAKAEVPTIQLVGFKTTRDEIWELYNSIYQLRRSPGPPPYGPECTEELVQEICTFLKERLWWRQGSSQSKEESEWSPTSTLRMQVGGDGSCNHALSKAREAHQQVIEATHMLEEKIEWLSQLATRIGSTSQWHSCSHGCVRRQSRGCLRGHTRTPTGEDHARTPMATSCQGNQRGRCFPSPSPTQPRRQVTFQDQQGKSLSEEYSLGEHMGQASNRGEPEEYNLGPPPTLEPELGVFPGGAEAPMRHERRSWPATRALCGKLWGMGGVASMPRAHARVVGGISGHPQHGGL